jgi:hypothetical protein
LILAFIYFRGGFLRALHVTLKVSLRRKNAHAAYTRLISPTFGHYLSLLGVTQNTSISYMHLFHFKKPNFALIGHYNALLLLFIYRVELFDITHNIAHFLVDISDNTYIYYLSTAYAYALFRDSVSFQHTTPPFSD